MIIPLHKIQVSPPGFVQLAEGPQGDAQAQQAGDEGRLNAGYNPLEGRIKKGDGQHRAPNKIRDARGGCWAKIGAEMFWGHGHKHRPIARGRPQYKAEHIEIP